ncbi:MAG TPA: hypothetical protein VL125_09760 [Pelobium sp.]|nr:hypothetical protein [Pelobium sp.]
MKLFKRTRTYFSQDEVAQKIAERITGRQQRIADYLNKRTKNFSSKSLLFSLIGFCTVFASYLIYLLISALN